MLLADACLELRYAKDWSAQTAAWYTSRLGLFLAWCEEYHLKEIEELTLPLLRRYVVYLQSRPSRRGGTLDSYTVHGHVATLRTLLFWAASEGLVDESIPRKLKPPRREQKVLQILT